MILILSVLGGFLNRWRGGMDFLNAPHQVRRLVLAFVPTAALHLPFFHITGFCWAMLVSYILFLVLGIIPGWGSWMFCGRSEDSWKHNEDAIWVEYLTYWCFGKKWIPFYHGLENHAEVLKYLGRFNYRESPTKEVRPFQWRNKMETWGMAFRGLGITMPAPLMFYFYLVEIGYNKPFLLLILPTGLLMGLCYSFAFFLSKDGKLGKLINTSLGEILTGATVMSGVIYLISSYSV